MCDHSSDGRRYTAYQDGAVPIESAAAYSTGGGRADTEASHASAAAAAAAAWQPRPQTYRELPLYDKSMRRAPPWRVIPRTRTLCKLLAGLMALTVLFHAASCGFFFCIRFPRALEFPHDMYNDIRDIYILAGGPRWMSRAVVEADKSPKLIPRVIHQTYKSSSVPADLKVFMHSWRRLNEDWEIRFYDDEACINFVQWEFPEYLDAYRSLETNVERSDFFRYMVVLRSGGVYADIDVECRKPLNSLIMPRDTLIVGWENEFSAAEEARNRKYVRKRQVLQWMFAAAPGHPALRDICDHIASSVDTRFTGNKNFDTLERTGPGAFTDVILKHAELHPLSKKDDPWNVRIMPKVHFGVHPIGLDDMGPDSPDIVVQHHFVGTWKKKGGWGVARELSPARILKRLLSRLFDIREEEDPVVEEDEGSQPLMEAALPFDRQAKQLYPVSITWQPPFTMLVDLKGHGDLQAESDIAASLTAWGRWQPALAPGRGPSVAEALVGSLGGKGAERRVLLDVGAGNGYFSLAAAARGHDVIAFELSNASLASFEASAKYNGFQKAITLHKVPLGELDEEVCIESQIGHIRLADLETSRGYGHPQVHNRSALGMNCVRAVQRRRGASLVPEDVEVGAVRVSVTGWDGWVLEGLRELMLRNNTPPPGVVLLELQPQAVRQNGYEGGALGLLRKMHSWGYTDVSHSGHVCDERWHNITRSIRLRGAIPMATQEALKQPTWCTLPPDKFEIMVERAPPKLPENILFTYKGALAPGNPPGGAPRALVDPPPPPDALLSNHSSPGGRAELSVSDAAQSRVPAAGSSGAAGPSVGRAASSA